MRSVASITLCSSPILSFQNLTVSLGKVGRTAVTRPAANFNSSSEEGVRLLTGVLLAFLCLRLTVIRSTIAPLCSSVEKQRGQPCSNVQEQ